MAQSLENVESSLEPPVDFRSYSRSGRATPATYGCQLVGSRNMRAEADRKKGRRRRVAQFQAAPPLLTPVTKVFIDDRFDHLPPHVEHFTS